MRRAKQQFDGEGEGFICFYYKNIDGKETMIFHNGKDSDDTDNPKLSKLYTLEGAWWIARKEEHKYKGLTAAQYAKLTSYDRVTRAIFLEIINN
jgi:hypothetical protein